MKLGLISDVHADADSLERALALLVARGADKILCAGDVVEKGPEGDRVVETLERWLIPTVQGNHDLNAVRHAWMVGAGHASPDEAPLTPGTVAWLGALPVSRHYTWERRHVMISHAAPDDQSMGLLPDHIPKRARRSLRALEADILVVGHTHRPMRVRYGDVWIVNPGSVCRGRSRDSHTCALLTLPDATMEVFDLRRGEPTPFEDVVFA